MTIDEGDLQSSIGLREASSEASRTGCPTDVTGRLIEYDYDPNGRMELVEDPTSWATYEYDTRGRMKKETFSNGVYSDYGYDNASRLTSLNHKKTADNSLILGYAAMYDVASRLTQAVESPTTATTTYAYDHANRLTSEDRTGANPYLSDYTYNSVGLRDTAFRSEGGITSHDGAYSYDDAGRLTQVVEEADGPASYENYTWNNDSTLASYPGPGYTRILDYDEEGRMTKISRQSGGTTTPKFEYAYGFDGGRRWRKDVASDVWNWYPCGVACCAGELVELTSDLTGATWSTSSLNLSGAMGEIARRGASIYRPNIGGGTAAFGTIAQSLRVEDSFGMERAGASLGLSEPQFSGSVVGDESLAYLGSGQYYLADVGIETFGEQWYFTWDSDCFMRALRQALLAAGFTAAFWAAIGWECWACLGSAAITCMNPATSFLCGAAMMVCRAVCGPKVVLAIAGILTQFSASFVATYKECIEQKRLHRRNPQFPRKTGSAKGGVYL